VNLNIGSLTHAQELVVAEVGRLNSTPGKFHLLLLGRTQSHGERSFNLSDKVIAIDDGAAVNGTDHPVHPDLSRLVVYRDFSDLGNIASMGRVGNNSSSTTCWQ